MKFLRKLLKKWFVSTNFELKWLLQEKVVHKNFLKLLWIPTQSQSYKDFTAQILRYANF